MRAPSRTTPPPGMCDANQPTASGSAHVSRATAHADDPAGRQRPCERPADHRAPGPQAQRREDDHHGGRQPPGETGPRDRHHVAVPDTAEGQRRHRGRYSPFGLQCERRRPVRRGRGRAGVEQTRRPPRVRSPPRPAPTATAQRRAGPPTAPATRATAVTTPALALSDPSTRTTGNAAGSTSSRRQRCVRCSTHGRQAQAIEHRPVTDQQPSRPRGDSTGRPTDHGEPADHREIGHQSRGAQSSRHERTEQDDLLQHHARGRPSRAPPPRRRTAPPEAGWWPDPGSPTAWSSSGTQTMS